MRRMKWWRWLALILLVTVAACTKYERQVVPFQLPAAYPNATEAAETTIAAKAYDGKDEASAAFGFDIRSAGILPIQVIFDNKGAHSLEIVPAQTFLVDEANNLWPILDANLAYDRINKKTELGNVVPEGAKSGLLAGAAGSNRVHVSTDNGTNWTRSRKEPSGQSGTCVLMAPHFTRDGKAYAATSGTGSAFSCTTDGGATWNQIGLIDTKISEIRDLAVSPNYDQDSTLFMLTWGGEYSLWRS